MRSRYLFVAAFAAAVLLSPIRDVEACGPIFEDEVFVSDTNPDDLAAFSKGQLAIFQARFDSDEYAVAFRYLNGGKLSAKEQASSSRPVPIPTLKRLSSGRPSKPLRKPQKNLPRPSYGKKPAQNMFQPSPLPTSKSVFKPSADGFRRHRIYLNCPNPSFQTAVLTLRKRAVTWGKSNSSLLDWIHAQDAVFSNCDGKAPSMPSALPTVPCTAQRRSRLPNRRC